MPITGNGWEFHIIRKEEQKAGDKYRTVGNYQIYHNGVAQTGPGMKGMVAERGGPGDNQEAENKRRIEQGLYTLYTQSGTKYVTIGYKESDSFTAIPRPGIELGNTGNRTEILIHPGRGFLSSVGCINPCTNLPNAGEPIDFIPSRLRVIAIINDMKNFIAGFPTSNGKKIPNAFVVIDGEPEFLG